ncbi:MAG: gamma-glutamylcyclotransferase [Fimbriimonadaceae bacterium]|nr:gamma-glutamylcyclotransferase [Fimbriimonadaceae bacterium]
MSERRVDVFFYGLFMDGNLLRKAGVEPNSPRRAYVDGFALRIGHRATLVPSAGDRAYGMLFALTHQELVRLYAAPGLEEYHSEAVLAQPLGGTPLPALCYNLCEAPQTHERNPEYAGQLQRVLRELGFPEEYVTSIS